MITGGAITADVRRESIRELAGITAATLNDDDLDRKVPMWDSVARSYFGVVGVELDGTEPYFNNLITVSNLHASAAIRQGIGGADNIAAAADQLRLAKDVIAANNRIAPEQGDAVIAGTSGINEGIGTFN